MTTAMNWGVTALTVRYGHRVALEDVSLDAPPGSITAVVGGDGAGKSTLLRALVGGVRPDSGTVRRPPTRQLGYFSGATGSYPDLTVSENLDFAASAYHASASGRRAELLDAASLSHVPERLAGQLSGGMRQKLGLVMAMLHEPTLLVLDEPSTGIDPVSRTELTALINRAAAAGTAVVLSTAYLDEAERAGHVLVLDRGRTLRSGNPDAIIASVPGSVLASTARPGGGHSWRRGSGWHHWIPPGQPVPSGSSPAPVDLEDAAIVAALQRSVS
jgi:ABC-type multidrug transport system ATPase subunit